MHQQAQLRLKKDAVEKLGAATYVVIALDTYRTRTFKEENWLLGGGNGPFGKEKSLVFATPLSDPAGRASAIYGVSRRALRWGTWVENSPHWFVIDRNGNITFVLKPTFATPTAYQDDVDKVIKALEEAAR
jgi:hypothetical protein